MKKILLLVILSAIFFSCHKPQGFEYRNVKDISVDSIGFGQSTLSMSLVYFNPNNFGVELKHVDCDVYVNNNYLGKYELDTLMHIQKKSEFSLPSRMNVDMHNLFKNSLAALLGQQFLLNVTGNTRVGKAGIFFNVPFSYSGQQTIKFF